MVFLIQKIQKGYKINYGLKLCCSSVDEGEKTYGNYRKIVYLLGKILLEEDTYAIKRWLDV